MATLHDGPWLERVAIEVSDLDRWIGLFEGLLGPGFERHQVAQAAGTITIAIHPAGIELVQTATERPRLRSFHLATTDIEMAMQIVRGLGWQHIDSTALGGRRHEILDAEGLRLLLVQSEADGSGTSPP